MASINKLAIRGVRAFSPDDEEQVIDFGFPLTIIVGSNGCGKTTIIEALKYAITGAMPPGVKSGQAFVHDPKSAGQSNVKASIKLRFTNRGGNKMVVVRSMEVTQKKTTLTFKALDGVLRTTNPDTGERISMSHKCTELDRQIPTMIGVSKPILEHVVFCHQEDSSWPLSEGAVLKKRFDEIFDSTRYAKALKAILEVKKDYSSKAKELKVDLASLAAFKHTAGQFRLEMEDVAEKISESEEVAKECERKIEEQSSLISNYMAELTSISCLEDEAQEKKNELDHELGIRDNIRSMLEEDLTSRFTRSQLERNYQASDSHQAATLQTLREKQQLFESLDNELASLQREKDHLVEQRARLSTELAAHERNVSEQSRKIRQIASTYTIEVEGESNSSSKAIVLSALTESQISTGGDTVIGATQESIQGGTIFSEQQVNSFMRSVDQKIKSMEADIREMKTQHQTLQDNIMAELGLQQGKMSLNEKDKQKIQEELANIRREISFFSTQTPSYSFRSIRKRDVEDAKKVADECARSFKELSNDALLQLIPNDIKKNQEEIDKIKRNIATHEDTLAELRSHAEQQQAITTLEKEIEKETVQLQELIDDIKPDFDKISVSVGSLDLPSMEELCVEIDGKKKLVAQRLQSVNTELSEKHRRVTECSTTIEHCNSNLVQLQQRIVSLDDTIIVAVYDEIQNYEKENNVRPTASMNVDPKELLCHIEEKLIEIEERNMKSPESVVWTIKRLKKMSVKTDATGSIIDIICPCCMRGLTDEDVKVFSKRMDELKDVERSEIIKVDQTIEKEKILYKRWKDIVASGLNSWYERSRCSKETRDLENVLIQKKEEKNGLLAELKRFEQDMECLKNESENLSNLFNEAVRFRYIAQRIKDRQFSIKQAKSRIFSPNGDGRDLKQVEADYLELMQKKDKLTEDNTKLNKQVTSLNLRISNAASAASQAEKEAREKEALYKESLEAAGRKNVLEERSHVLTEEEKKLQEKDAPLRQSIMIKQADLERLRASQNEALRTAEMELQSFRQDYVQLGEINKCVNQYLKTNKASDLERTKGRLNDIEIKKRLKNEQHSEMKIVIGNLKQDQEQKDRNKKNIRDNLALLECTDKIDILENELSDLRKSLAIQEQRKAAEKYQSALSCKESFKEKKTRCEGRMGGLKEQLKNLTLKLKSSEFKDIDERHRVKMIEHQTTLLAVSDLDKYHTALDKALMKFHSLKIADINKIIRELWSMTYKGEDIYNIEIVSGEEGATSNAAKSYNYRVVMSKGNTKMDMRGRCSAGQRVLACLVIRLALAETFCLNCGLMCLDEPTTNLDHANKQGLAVALAQIISTRASQHNFQLVVITHDEEFVHMMKQELATQTGFDMPERYFHISREESVDGKFYSRIRAVDWDTI